ncbi:glycosyltransferase family 2 protein [Sphingobium sp. CAP-1]|uniref:glycosyltransferase family 2 protein n=1 Tax=Sphingobium sp. CAP-1 TaxID=2676077 RepID=UPI0012BB1F9C|nr:glycosyltransferase [Sphingobium sp. CAP-1]QGP78191.1 glycosyltransferase [Sphingobium sp. CAP-1]
MALAVLDLDIDRLPDRLELTADQEGALALLRLDGAPCGQAILWRDAHDNMDPLRKRLLRAANSSFWERWLERELGLSHADPDPATLPGATVVICTRDRTEDLERCLDGLLAMPDQPDILVVDNAPSTDGTRALVARYPMVRYLLEPRPGLDVARNTAIRNSSSEIIAFIDDDAVPDRLWLRHLLRNFEDAMVLAAGGLTMALELDAPAQIAFQRFGGFSRGFKRFTYDALTTDPFDAWHAAAGVNLAIRRSATDLIGLFDEALDAGTLSCAGGDTDYCRRILTAGYRIAYDPQALNWHRHRRSMEELQRQVYGYECAFFAILTKSLLFERNPRALLRGLKWLRHQLPSLARSFRHQQHRTVPFNIIWVQTRGAFAGPGRYLRARRVAAAHERRS